MLCCFVRGSQQESQQRGRRSCHSGVTQSQKTENGPKCAPIFTKHDADDATSISCGGGNSSKTLKLLPKDATSRVQNQSIPSWRGGTTAACLSILVRVKGFHYEMSVFDSKNPQFH